MPNLTHVIADPNNMHTALPVMHAIGQHVRVMELTNNQRCNVFLTKYDGTF